MLRVIWLLWLAVTLTGISFAAWAAPAGSNQNATGNASATSLTLNTSLSVDSANDRDYQIGGQVAVSDSTSYNFLYEYTSSPASRTDLLTHTYSAGVDQSINSATGFGLRYERWGKPGDILSDSLYGSFYWQNKSWQVTALSSLRQISLDTRSGKVSGIPPGESIDIADYPLGLRLDFTGLPDWLFEVSTTRHDYNRNPRILNNRRALDFFNGSILTLSQGFLSHSTSARIERDFDLSSLALDYEIDRSALNGSYSYTTDVDFNTPIADSFDMEITSGVTRSQSLPETGFIIFNLIYYH